MARLADLIENLGIEVKREGEDKHARAGWLQMRCPFCSYGGTKYHLGLSLTCDFFNCYQCGRHAVNETVMALTGKSFHETKLLTKDLDRPRFVATERHTGTLVLPKGIDETLAVPHRRYLRTKREFTREQIDELERVWELRSIGIAGGIRRGGEFQSLAWRVFIPIVYRNKVVSWTTRAIRDNAGLRYLSAAPEEEALSHRGLLYGEDYVRHTIAVHEGPADPWKTGPGCTATFGTGFTRSQVLRIAKYHTRAVCFDSEPEAQKRARELCSLLEVFDGRTLNIVLDAKDAGSASDREIRLFRRTVFGRHLA